MAATTSANERALRRSGAPRVRPQLAAENQYDAELGRHDRDQEERPDEEKRLGLRRARRVRHGEDARHDLRGEADRETEEADYEEAHRPE